jgi:hypothetical protein
MFGSDPAESRHPQWLAGGTLRPEPSLEPLAVARATISLWSKSILKESHEEMSERRAPAGGAISTFLRELFDTPHVSQHADFKLTHPLPPVSSIPLGKLMLSLNRPVVTLGNRPKAREAGRKHQENSKTLRPPSLLMGRAAGGMSKENGPSPPLVHIHRTI